MEITTSPRVFTIVLSEEDMHFLTELVGEKSHIQAAELGFTGEDYQAFYRKFSKALDK